MCFHGTLVNLNDCSVKVLLKQCFIHDICKNVVKIPCMQEVYAHVEMCRVVTVGQGQRYSHCKKSDVAFLDAVKKNYVW